MHLKDLHTDSENELMTIGIFHGTFEEGIIDSKIVARTMSISMVTVDEFEGEEGDIQ